MKEYMEVYVGGTFSLFERSLFIYSTSCVQDLKRRHTRNLEDLTCQLHEEIDILGSCVGRRKLDKSQHSIEEGEVYLI